MTEPTPPRRTDICTCPEPVLDSDFGIDDGDDGFCWRCKRPVLDPEVDE